MNLTNKAPRMIRRLAGLTLIASLTGLSAYSAWATQASTTQSARTFEASMTITDKFGTATPTVRAMDGELAEIKHGDKSGAMRYSLTMSQVKEGTVELNLIVRRNDEIIDEPRLLVELNQPGALSFHDDNHTADFKIDFSVSKVDTSAKAK